MTKVSMGLSFANQGEIVDMRVIEFVTTKSHHGRRGSPAIPAGTTLYAIEYVGYNVYYTYSYQDRHDAITCIENSKAYNTNNEFYMQWNCVQDKEDAMHVAPRKVKISNPGYIG